MRIFVAVDPSEACCARVARTIERLRGLAPSARWVGEGSSHVTLAFLGEVDAPAVPPIVESLATVGSRHRPFELGLGGGGTFGSPLASKVLWVGITLGNVPLGAVQRDVAAALAPHGYPPERRPFQPHLTLARARHPRGEAAFAACATAIDVDLGTSEIAALTLYESVTGGQGARYVPLATLPFGRVI